MGRRNTSLSRKQSDNPKVINRAPGVMRCSMTPDEAILFIKEHGVVLASAKGPVPRLTEAIVHESIKGSWWAHPKSHQIFAVFQAVTHSEEVLVCRLVNGKVTFIHRRLWPALIRVAKR